MKTLHNIYLDLSKLTAEDIKDVYKILLSNKEPIWSGSHYKLIPPFNFLLLNLDDEWSEFSFENRLQYAPNKTEVSLSEFRELFTASRGEEKDLSAKSK